MRQFKTGIFLIVFLIASGLGSRDVAAATLMVTSSAESGPGSLREAIALSSSFDRIEFDPALAGTTITLASPLPDITHNLSILGGTHDISISGANSMRSGFVVAESGSLSLIGLTFSNGFANQGGAFFISGGISLVDVTLSNNNTPTTAGMADMHQGGAIYNEGTTRFTRLTISDSSAYQGGAIFNTSWLVSQESIMQRNSATDGGAIFHAGSLIQVLSTAFNDNQAVNGGAITVFSSSDRSNILFSSFAGNSTTGNGGTLYVTAGSSLSIRDSTLSGSDAVQGGAIYSEGTLSIYDSTISDMTASSDGGGIYTVGSLTMQNAEINTASAATQNGGAIYNIGTTTLVSSTLRTNFARRGGALYNAVSGVAELSDSSITNGYATLRGGGVLNRGVLTVTTSLLSSLNAPDGGGVYNTPSGELTLRNMTVSAATADDAGGGLYNLGTVTANQVTIANGAAGTSGGSLFDEGVSSWLNSVMAGSTDGAECVLGGDGTFSAENTLIQDGSCDALSNPADNNLTGDPQLMPLADNGGPTETHAFTASSLAAGAGDASRCELADQRGYLRYGGCDIGAYEISSGRCASWDGTTQRVTTDSQGLSVAVAAQSAGAIVKVAGDCLGALRAAPDSTTAVIVPQVDMTIEGGYSALDWSQQPDSDSYPTLLDALDMGRVVYVENDATVTLRHLTLRGGEVDGEGAGILASGGIVTLDFVELSDNHTASFMHRGGGAFVPSGGELRLFNSTLADNSSLHGGGIYALGASVTVSNSLVSGNLGNLSSAGIHAESSLLQVFGTTFEGNTGPLGTAFYLNGGSAEMQNSTLSNDDIHVESGSATLSNATLFYEGEYSLIYLGNGGTLNNMLIAGSSEEPLCQLGTGAIAVVFDSLVQDGSCITDGVGGNLAADPELQPLADNGGPTPTFAILASSPAHNAGNSPNCPAADQRGMARDDGSCDIGAFEVVAASTPTRVALRAQGLEGMSRSGILVTVVLLLLLTLRGSQFRPKS